MGSSGHWRRLVVRSPARLYRVFSEEELRSLSEGFAWLKAAEKSFDFWNNSEDAGQQL